ncbi:hypothetical protein ACFE04_018285 [Oxalis oulophora]
MKLLSLLFVVFLTWVLFSGGVFVVFCKVPEVVNIGAVFSFDSVIGRVAKPAIKLAVSDVNKDTRILNGTILNLIMEDDNSSVFLASVHAFRLVDEEVVAIIGPQSSAIARTVSEIANGLKVPLVSYAATDPTLSALQFPFFIRATQSDDEQMAAIVDMIYLYGWKEVIAVYVDNDYGRNGVFALDEKLTNKMLKMSHKVPLPVDFDQDIVMGLLNKSKRVGPRVYVVHLNPDPKLTLFAAAQKLQMMTSNYAWFATDWLSTSLDSFAQMNRTLPSIVEGVVGLRPFIPASTQKRDFVTRWRKLPERAELNTYGFYAYDAVWAVAYSIHKFIKENNTIGFSLSDQLKSVGKKQGGLQLDKLRVFDGGNELRKILLQTNVTGLAGEICFNKDQNLVTQGYEVINIHGKAMHNVGYWSITSGLSILPPANLTGKPSSYSSQNHSLLEVTWPGGKTERPRGWILADDGRPLIIGVPRRASFVEFVTEDNSSHEIRGYCIDVFLEARKLVPYDVPYIFKPFGDGRSNPSYDQLVGMVADDVFDAAIGDIAIVTNRTRIVDFTQPFAATGLVIVAPVMNTKSSAWVFLKPFEAGMWCATAASFVIIAFVIWILEHRVNDEFRGPPKRQLVTMFLRGSTKSTWTIGDDHVAFPIIGDNFKLYSKLDFDPYSSTAFFSDHWDRKLDLEQLAYWIPKEYENALRLGPNRGGVAAIVDELLYVDLFLKDRTGFGIIGQPFTKNGWGFAFQRGSPLTLDMSTAILKLSESGKLQEINKKWLCGASCHGKVQSDTSQFQLHINSFWGLYLLIGGICVLAFLVFLIRSVRQYVRYKKKQMSSIASTSAAVSSNSRCPQVIFNFFDFIDEKEEAIKNLFKQPESENNTQLPQASSST